MTKTIFFILILFFTSCGYEYEDTLEQKRLFEIRNSEPMDTLICKYTVSTGSLDLYRLQGKLSFPNDIKNLITDTLSRDINVCGNFPKDFINIASWYYDEGSPSYRIIGKTISTDSVRLAEASVDVMGNAPLFYIVEWEKINFDYHLWNKKEKKGFPHREKMVNDLLKYFKLVGQPKDEIENILGQPDYKYNNKIVYKISQRKSKSSDKTEETNLIFKYHKNEIISEVMKSK
jgi:hypothetical protein